MDSTKKKYLNIAIMLILMIFTRFIPPVGHITSTGWATVGVVFGTIYGWVTISFGWPSLLGLTMCLTTGIYTANDLWAASFGSLTSVILLVIFIMSAWMEDTGISDVVISKLLSLKIANGRPWISIFLFILACFFVSLLTNSIAGAMIFLSMLKSFCRQMNIEPYHPMNAILLIGIAISSCLSELALPIKGCALMYLNVLVATTGYVPDFFRYTIYVLPMCLLLLVLLVVFAKFILRVNTDGMVSYVVDEENIVKMTKRQAWSVGMIFLFLIALMLPSFLKGTIFNTLGLGGIALAFLVICSIIHIDGEPLMDLTTVSKKMSLDLWFVALSFTPIATSLTNASTGVSAQISVMLQPVLSMPVLVVVLVFGISACALTQVANNAVVAMVMITVVGTISGALGDINMMGLVMVIMVGAHLSCILPSANFIFTACYAQKDLIKASGLFRYGLFMAALLLTVVLVCVYPISNFVFK